MYNAPGYDDLKRDSKEHYCYKIQIFLLFLPSVPSFWDKHPTKRNLESHMIFCRGFVPGGDTAFH